MKLILVCGENQTKPPHRPYNAIMLECFGRSVCSAHPTLLASRRALGESEMTGKEKPRQNGVRIALVLDL
jgi:hypothetical protein